MSPNLFLPFFALNGKQDNRALEVAEYIPIQVGTAGSVEL